MGPLAWLGWLAPILIGARVGSTAMMLITVVRLLRVGRQSDMSAPTRTVPSGTTPARPTASML